MAGDARPGLPPFQLEAATIDDLEHRVRGLAQELASLLP
jgi:hypothetical protein